MAPGPPLLAQGGMRFLAVPVLVFVSACTAGCSLESKREGVVTHWDTLTDSKSQNRGDGDGGRVSGRVVDCRLECAPAGPLCDALRAQSTCAASAGDVLVDIDVDTHAATACETYRPMTFTAKVDVRYRGPDVDASHHLDVAGDGYLKEASGHDCYALSLEIGRSIAGQVDEQVAGYLAKH
jgi:hypothetical protein